MKHIFISNPYAGKTMFAENLREKLAQIEGLDYFVFITRYAGYEKELVKKIRHCFGDEKLRFYCRGGSGTMRNMLNGFEDLSDVTDGSPIVMNFDGELVRDVCDWEHRWCARD